jgi:hypothetical protein
VGNAITVSMKSHVASLKCQFLNVRKFVCLQWLQSLKVLSSFTANGLAVYKTHKIKDGIEQYCEMISKVVFLCFVGLVTTLVLSLEKPGGGAKTGYEGVGDGYQLI